MLSVETARRISRDRRRARTETEREPDEDRPRGPVWAVGIAALLLLALGLRLWGIKQGLPYAYNIDENAHFVPRAIGFFGHTLNPYYFVNPPGYTELLYAVFGIWFGGGDAAARAYATDPTEVFVVARVVSALLGTLAVWLTYLAGARLFDRRVGLLAAAVMTVAFLPVFYSHLALNDTPALAPAALALFGAAGILRRGRILDYALAGIGVGFAAGIKYTAGIVLVPVLVAAWFRWRDEPRVQAARRRLGRLSPRALARSRSVRLAVLAGAAVLLAFAVATPYSFLDPKTFAGGILHQASAASGSEKLGATQSNGYLYYLWTLTWGLGWAPALAAAAGAVLLFRRDRRLAWLLVPAVVFYFVFMGGQERFFGRWFMPVYPILCVLAAWGALALVGWLSRHRPRWRLALTASAAALLVGQGLVYSIHNDMVLTREDTRGQTRDWLAAHVPDGARIVTEPVFPDSWVREPGRFPPTAGGDRWAEFFPGDTADSLSTVTGDLLAAHAARAARAPPTERGERGAAQAVSRLSIAFTPNQLPAQVLPNRRQPDVGVVGGEGYTRDLSPELIDVYRREGACWVVSGSTQYERAFSVPERVPDAIAYYRRLRREGDVVYRTSPYDEGAGPVKFNFDWSFDYYPLAYHRPGPVMVVYRLHGGRCG